MLGRVLGPLSLLFVGATAQAQGGVTVSVCYSEFPTSSCSFVEVPRHQPTLEGPVPEGTSRMPEPFQFGENYYRFLNVGQGNYIVRESGYCNPFGCFLDTAVTVGDEDVYVRVQQIGGQTPTRPPSPSPTPPTPTATSIAALCLGDGNADRMVTIDELVEAVSNAISGCPTTCGDPSVSRMFAVCQRAETEQACVSAGGTWGNYPYSGAPGCFCLTGQGGCPCAAAEDCVGLCQAALRADCETVRVREWACSDVEPRAGCWCVMAGGQPRFFCNDP
jgi:hypothetical protein